jgi:hypothetical protein
MATIVHQHEADAQASGSFNMIAVLLLAIVIIYLIFAYAVPALNRTGSPQINVPDKVDVNINQPGK